MEIFIREQTGDFLRLHAMPEAWRKKFHINKVKIRYIELLLFAEGESFDRFSIVGQVSWALLSVSYLKSEMRTAYAP